MFIDAAETRLVAGRLARARQALGFLMVRLPGHVEARLKAARYTYPEVGHTAGVLPAGYRQLRRSVELPPPIEFEQAKTDLLAWKVHQWAGLKVIASSEIAGPDSTLILCIGPKFMMVRAPLRVVYVVDEPNRCGFAYGTLPGHPECGEEAFVLDSDGETVTFTITAFSRPATLLSKVAGPVATRVQDFITDRYLHSWHP